MTSSPNASSTCIRRRQLPAGLSTAVMQMPGQTSALGLLNPNKNIHMLCCVRIALSVWDLRPFVILCVGLIQSSPLRSLTGQHKQDICNDRYAANSWDTAFLAWCMQHTIFDYFRLLPHARTLPARAHRTSNAETEAIRKRTETTDSAKASSVGLAKTVYNTFFKSPFPQIPLGNSFDEVPFLRGIREIRGYVRSVEARGAIGPRGHVSCVSSSPRGFHPNMPP